MQYETLNDTSSDSDATASSDSEAETKDVSGKKYALFKSMIILFLKSAGVYIYV